MSLLTIRSAILAQGAGAVAPAPGDAPAAWTLDPGRTPPGYTLSDGNRTAVNTTGGTDYRSWVPASDIIRPWHGPRYWEVLCAPGGASAFDGYMGIIPDTLRDDFDAGSNPITSGAIGWRGNGSLWSSNTTSAVQRLTNLPAHGAGDVLMFVLDPASASLWIGLNGSWHSDPATEPPVWTTAPADGFLPCLQGRSPGDGGTLRSLPDAFTYPVPAGAEPLILPLAQTLADLAVHAAGLWIEHGGTPNLTSAQCALYIERHTP